MSATKDADEFVEEPWRWNPDEGGLNKVIATASSLIIARCSKLLVRVAQRHLFERLLSARIGAGAHPAEFTDADLEALAVLAKRAKAVWSKLEESK